MNQILYTMENQEEKNRAKSIMLFFGITIIIFGLIMVAMGGYRIASAKMAKEEALEAAKIPNITLSIQDNKVKINIKHIREIKDIIYSWNNGEDTVLAVYTDNFTGSIDEEIDIPGGTNTLNIRVVDVDGKTATATQKFTYKGTYMDLSVIDNKSLKIIVTDMIGLQSVTYSWNGEQEQTVYPDENNQSKIEIKEMQVKGITKPTMKINYNSDRTMLNLKLNDEQGIESYSYKLSSAPISEIAENGNIIPNFKEKLTVVTSQTKQGNKQTSITEQLPFQTGFNYLEITIKNTEGVEENFSGWCAK